MNSRIAQAIDGLSSLFDDPLSDVSFPGVDREVLTELRAAVDRAREEVAACEEALDAANRVRESHEDALIKAAILAQRYARIYASEDEALLACVDALELEERPAKKKPRRPRKKKPEQTIPLALPSDESAADAGVKVA
ncbi:MAG: hypothetical protein AAF411_00345 [Myxococcota bacterium]